MEIFRLSRVFVHLDQIQFALSTGMYHWYGNNLPEAIKFFELVKYDQEWGQQALSNMVEIHLVNSDGNNERAEEILQVCTFICGTSWRV